MWQKVFSTIFNGQLGDTRAMLRELELSPLTRATFLCENSSCVDVVQIQERFFRLYLIVQCQLFPKALLKSDVLFIHFVYSLFLLSCSPSVINRRL